MENLERDVVVVEFVVAQGHVHIQSDVVSPLQENLHPEKEERGHEEEEKTKHRQTSEGEEERVRQSERTRARKRARASEPGGVREEKKKTLLRAPLVRAERERKKENSEQQLKKK